MDPAGGVLNSYTLSDPGTEADECASDLYVPPPGSIKATPPARTRLPRDAAAAATALMRKCVPLSRQWEAELDATINEAAVRKSKQKAAASAETTILNPCGVCMAASVNAVYPLCGHTICMSCAGRIGSTCPHCRAGGARAIRLYGLSSARPASAADKPPAGPAGTAADPIRL